MLKTSIKLLKTIDKEQKCVIMTMPESFLNIFGGDPLSSEKDSLLESVKNGDSASFEALMSEYKALIESSVTRFAPSFDKAEEGIYDRDDLRQMVSLALYKAAVSYDGDKYDSVTFGLYAKICINNSMISSLRKLGARKRKKTPTDMLGVNVRSFPDNVEFKPEDVSAELIKALSEYEQKVLNCVISGKSITDTADFLSRSEKSVRNAMYRIKAKLKGLFTAQ